MKTYKLFLIAILFISSAVTVSADGPKKSFPDKVKEVFDEALSIEGDDAKFIESIRGEDPTEILKSGSLET